MISENPFMSEEEGDLQKTQCNVAWQAYYQLFQQFQSFTNMDEIMGNEVAFAIVDDYYNQSERQMNILNLQIRLDHYRGIQSTIAEMSASVREAIAALQKFVGHS